MEQFVSKLVYKIAKIRRQNAKKSEADQTAKIGTGHVKRWASKNKRHFIRLVILKAVYTIKLTFARVIYRFTGKIWDLKILLMMDFTIKFIRTKVWF